MPKPYSWSYLTHRPLGSEVWGPFSTAFVLVFLVAFFVGVFLYNNGGQYLTTDPVKRKYLRKYAGFFLIPVCLGLFFFLIRVLQIDPFTFGRRIWLYLSLLGFLGVLVWAGLDIRAHYRRDVHNYHRRRTNRQYIPARGRPVSDRQ